MLLGYVRYDSSHILAAEKHHVFWICHPIWWLPTSRRIAWQAPSPTCSRLIKTQHLMKFGGFMFRLEHSHFTSLYHISIISWLLIIISFKWFSTPGLHWTLGKVRSLAGCGRHLSARLCRCANPVWTAGCDQETAAAPSGRYFLKLALKCLDV